MDMHVKNNVASYVLHKPSNGADLILTYRYRVKDASGSTRQALRAQARAVNFVWNYCCRVDREAQRRWKAGMAVGRPSTFDLATLCRGVTKELGIHSDTVDAVCRKFADARDACLPKTPRLRSFKKNLDFVPFSNFKRPAKLDGGRLTVLGRAYHLWLSRPLPENGKPKSWEFSTDARRRWYVNIQVEVPEPEKRNAPSLGIDLGLKSVVALSNGFKIAAPRFYRQDERQLAVFQQRGQKVRARALAAKVANRRRHFLHVVSRGLVQHYGEIYVGGVSPKTLAKTRMAKSVGDAGWSMLRNMLLYKSIATGGVMRIVSERYSSQTCSACGVIPVGSPKGLGALGIRQWTCDGCGTLHDRDINAARNIEIAGVERHPPAVEIPVLKGGEDVKLAFDVTLPAQTSQRAWS
jgi:transposase